MSTGGSSTTGNNLEFLEKYFLGIFYKNYKRILQEISSKYCKPNSWKIIFKNNHKKAIGNNDFLFECRIPAHTGFYMSEDGREYASKSIVFANNRNKKTICLTA